MNMTEELNEDEENVTIVEVKRGRGRPRIPDELKKTKPKIYSGLPRGRPRLQTPNIERKLKIRRPRKDSENSRLNKVVKKPEVLEINIGDKEQISLIKDFINDDTLDFLPVKFVTKSNRGCPIELMVIKPSNSKYSCQPVNHENDDSDYSDNDESCSPSPPTSRGQGQPSTSKGRGRPRKYPKVEASDESETYNTPSTSKGRGRPRKLSKVESNDYSVTNSSSTTHRGRGRPRKTPQNDSDYSDDDDDENYIPIATPSTRRGQGQPSTSKGRGRPRKYLKESVPSTSRGISRTAHISYTEYNESDYSDDESFSPTPSSTSRGQGQPSTSKGPGRPRKYPKIEIDDDDSVMTSTPSTSKGRGRPRIHPKVEIDNALDDSNSLSSSENRSKGRGRPRKYAKVSDSDSGINDSPSTSKGPGRPRKYPRIDRPIEEDKPIEDKPVEDKPTEDKPKKGRGRPRKSLPSIHTDTMILEVEDGEAAIEHIPTDNHVNLSVKPKPGRGRPRKDARVTLETTNERGDYTEVKPHVNGDEYYSTDSDMKEEHQLLTDESSNCEDIDYCEQTNEVIPAIPLEDTESVSEIIS